MKILRHIFPIIVSIVFLTSCQEREGKVIPRGKLSEIYAEMLLMDQWIAGTPDVRRMADTSLVYEPILNKHGYTSDDYRKSVDVYMDDPERFARILRTTVSIFDQMLQDLEVQRLEQVKKDQIQKYLQDIRVDVEFDIDKQFPYLFKEPYPHYFDSIDVALDSTSIYRIEEIVCSDTTYEGVRMIIRDTITVAVDSASVK